jgi:hypothetical protein
VRITAIFRRVLGGLLALGNVVLLLLWPACRLALDMAEPRSFDTEYYSRWSSVFAATAIVGVVSLFSRHRRIYAPLALTGYLASTGVVVVHGVIVRHFSLIAVIAVAFFLVLGAGVAAMTYWHHRQ